MVLLNTNTFLGKGDYTSFFSIKRQLEVIDTWNKNGDEWINRNLRFVKEQFESLKEK